MIIDVKSFIQLETICFSDQQINFSLAGKKCMCKWSARLKKIDLYYRL